MYYLACQVLIFSCTYYPSQVHKRSIICQIYVLSFGVVILWFSAAVSDGQLYLHYPKKSTLLANLVLLNRIKHHVLHPHDHTTHSNMCIISSNNVPEILKWKCPLDEVIMYSHSYISEFRSCWFIFFIFFFNSCIKFKNVGSAYIDVDMILDE